MKKTKRTYQQKEKKIQLKVCDWIKSEYPDLLFMCDKTSGMRMPIGQAMVFKRMRPERAMPDLYIFNKSFYPNFRGLVLELKKDKNQIFDKKGSIRKNKHIQEQFVVLKKFSEQGFFADFAGGLEDAKEKINAYLKGFSRRI